jgi:hypothetical protein
MEYFKRLFKKVDRPVNILDFPWKLSEDGASFYAD